MAAYIKIPRSVTGPKGWWEDLSDVAARLHRRVLTIAAFEPRAKLENGDVYEIKFGEFIMTKSELAGRVKTNRTGLDRAIRELGPHGVKFMTARRLSGRSGSRSLRWVFAINQPGDWLLQSKNGRDPTVPDGYNGNSTVPPRDNGGLTLWPDDSGIGASSVPHQYTGTATVPPGDSGKVPIVPSTVPYSVPSRDSGDTRPRDRARAFGDCGDLESESESRLSLSNPEVDHEDWWTQYGLAHDSADDQDIAALGRQLQAVGLGSWLANVGAEFVSAWCEPPKGEDRLPFVNHPLPGGDPTVGALVLRIMPFLDAAIPAEVLKGTEIGGYDRFDAACKWVRELVGGIYRRPMLTGKIPPRDKTKAPFRLTLEYLIEGDGKDRLLVLRRIQKRDFDPKSWKRFDPQSPRNRGDDRD